MDWQFFWKTFHRLEPESFTLKIYPSVLTSVWRWEKAAYMHLLHFTLRCNYSISYISSRPGVSFRIDHPGRLKIQIQTPRGGQSLHSNTLTGTTDAAGHGLHPGSEVAWLAQDEGGRARGEAGASVTSQQERDDTLKGPWMSLMKSLFTEQGAAQGRPGHGPWQEALPRSQGHEAGVPAMGGGTHGGHWWPQPLPGTAQQGRSLGRMTPNSLSSKFSAGVSPGQTQPWWLSPRHGSGPRRTDDGSRREET